MPKDLDFNSKEFLQLEPEEKIARCTQLAEQAQVLAQSAPPEQRGYFLEIANQWLMLAEATRTIMTDSHDHKSTTRH